MFGNMRSLGEIDFDRIMEVCGRESFLEMLTKADVVSIVNWTMIPKMTSILQRIAEEIMPALGDAGPEGFFFDLTDPAKRSTDDIREVLEIISRFQGFSEVTLGLNFNEAHQVSDTLGLQKVKEASNPSGIWLPRFVKNYKFHASSCTPWNRQPAPRRKDPGGPRVLTPRTPRLPPVLGITSMRASPQPGFAVFPTCLPRLGYLHLGSLRALSPKPNPRPSSRPAHAGKRVFAVSHESGILISFEGSEGCGKSTQISRLADRLEEIDHRRSGRDAGTRGNHHWRGHPSPAHARGLLRAFSRNRVVAFRRKPGPTGA